MIPMTHKCFKIYHFIFYLSACIVTLNYCDKMKHTTECKAHISRPKGKTLSCCYDSMFLAKDRVHNFDVVKGGGVMSKK